MSGDRKAEIILFWKPTPPLNRNRKIFWMQSLARKVKGFQCIPALAMQIHVITRRVKKFFHQVETCVSDFVQFKRTQHSRARFKHSDRIFPAKFNRRSFKIFHGIPKGWRSADVSRVVEISPHSDSMQRSAPFQLCLHFSQARNNWNCKTLKNCFRREKVSRGLDWDRRCKRKRKIENCRRNFNT